MMTQTNPSGADRPASRKPEGRAEREPDGGPVTVETRFGALTFDDTNTVLLPHGIIGFPDFHEFGLAEIPDPRMGQFRLLQSLEQTDLAFLLLPVRLDGTTIADGDVDEACAALGIAREEAAFLLLVTLRKEEQGLSVSANVRAPIVLDTARRVGRQYVLPNPDYPIRHVL